MIQWGENIWILRIEAQTGLRCGFVIWCLQPFSIGKYLFQYFCSPFSSVLFNEFIFVFVCCCFSVKTTQCCQAEISDDLIKLTVTDWLANEKDPLWVLYEEFSSSSSSFLNRHTHSMIIMRPFQSFERQSLLLIALVPNLEISCENNSCRLIGSTF